MASANDRLAGIKDEITDLQQKLDEASTQDEALNAAIAAASLCLRAVKLSTDLPEQKSLRSRATTFITAAESIKKETSWASRPSSSDHPNPSQSQPQRRLLLAPVNNRALSTKEQTLVLKASFVNGSKFPPWTDPVNEIYFKSDAGSYYRDDGEMQLSAQQDQHFDRWERAANALATVTDDGQDKTPCMRSPCSLDLVQDVASDCSVVASLCVIANREEQGHGTLLTSILYPVDPAMNIPKISPNGCYIVKLYFNGTWRLVCIDDRLPVSKTQRLLHTVDLNCPNLLWPALVEKAYLKVRGGYDFPGSNTCTDLWALTGWIPEQIFIRDEDTDLDQLWNRIEKSQKYGDVMISLGTGHLSKLTEQAERLASEHSYAVLRLFVEEGMRKVELKNPWRDSVASLNDDTIHEVTAHSRSNNLLDDQALPAKINTQERTQSAGQVSGVFTMTYDNILQNFESIYLNWNPGLFSNRCEIHFDWTLNAIRSKNTNFVDSPQFAVRAASRTDVWLLLCKHLPGDRTEIHHPAEATTRTGMSDQTGFLSLYALNEGGNRVRTTGRLVKRSPYVDSSQVLLKLDMAANSTYTLVTSEQDMPTGTCGFTLIAFSHKPITLELARDLYSSTCETKAAWNLATAGGNGQSPRFAANPQFKLSVPSRTRLAIILEPENQSFAVNAKLMYSGGKRVAAVTKQSIILDSGDYRTGSAFAETEELDAGEYTVICSTFEAGQEGRFKLRVDSEQACRMIKLAGEHADRFRVDSLGPAHFQPKIARMAAPLQIRRMMKMTVKAKALSAYSIQHNSPIRVSIDIGRGEHVIHHAASCNGDFKAASAGVESNDAELWPDMAPGGVDVWLVLERLVAPAGGSAESYTVELLADCMRGEGWDVGQWRTWD